MAATKVSHMNSGDGENSYANNSGFQKSGISQSMHVLDKTLKDMFTDEHIEFPKCFKMVDMGCASGPNTLMAMSHVMNKIEDFCKQKNIKDDNRPEFEVFLNDVADNDFNNLFKSLPENKGRYFVYGLPGSFYDRLFPINSLHFAYSSYSIHWLSQVPEGLGDKNKENIFMAMTSPPEVYEAYAKQYKKDFHTFLSSRAPEIVSGGRMVLLFVARSVEDPSIKDDFSLFTVLAKTLAQMVPEGLVKMDDLYSFNLPMYSPCVQEVETSIQSEGSFTLDKIETFRVRFETDDGRQQSTLTEHNRKRAKLVADFVRGFLEPTLANHFGCSIMDNLFKRVESNFVDQLAIEDDASYFNIAISLSKK